MFFRIIETGTFLENLILRIISTTFSIEKIASYLMYPFGESIASGYYFRQTMLVYSNCKLLADLIAMNADP